MPDIASLIAQGSHNLWLFVPSALLLGALHGLEPGHSKTMMAAFIVAIRGTVGQAVLLGLSATFSHTLVVWLVALLGLHFGATWSAEASEPYFLLISALIMVVLAGWMMRRTWKFQHAHDAGHGHPHHDHHHAHDHGHPHHHAHCDHDHHDDDEDHTTPAPHSCGHAHHGVDAAALAGETDPHALAHARQIEQRFAGRDVSTGQLVLFGLTGGLLPCPASITVLLICLQLKKITLGALLVVCFSLGLAATMVMAGVIAAISVRQVTRRWSGFSTLAARAPYVSGVIILLIALSLALQALSRL